MSSPLPPSAPSASPSTRTRVRRRADRALYDAAAVYAVIDPALVCQVAFADATGVHCLPTACWRMGTEIYIHGSNGSRLLQALQAGVEAAVTTTQLDGLVLARSAFHHSMNYRSVVAHGRFDLVPEEEKALPMTAFLNHILPGRQDSVRAANAKEMAATTVLRLSLQEAGAKIRRGPPIDDAADLAWSVWASVLPLRLLPQLPQRDPQCQLPEPNNVQQWRGRRFDGA